MRYNPDIYHRRSMRLRGYDYSCKGAYFITICTHNRMPLFGMIENGKIILNEFGDITIKAWIKTESIRENVELGEFIIMPNHVHLILFMNTQPINEPIVGALRATPLQ